MTVPIKVQVFLAACGVWAFGMTISLIISLPADWRKGPFLVSVLILGGLTVVYFITRALLKRTEDALVQGLVACQILVWTTVMGLLELYAPKQFGPYNAASVILAFAFVSTIVACLTGAVLQRWVKKENTRVSLQPQWLRDLAIVFVFLIIAMNMLHLLLYYYIFHRA